MQHRGCFRMLMRPMTMLLVVVAMLWSAPGPWAEPTVTVYKDPT